MTPRRNRSRLESLRIRLPLLLLIYCTIVGITIFLIVSRTQEQRFEAEFAARQVMRATDLQDRTERAAERNELSTAQREFGELAQYEALKAAVFVSPDDLVLLSSRREWLNRSVDLTQLGVPAAERPRIEVEMAQALATRLHRVVEINDGDGLVLVMPASLPLVPGALAVDRSALIVLVYDLGLSKAIDAFYLRRLFLLIAAALVFAVFVLGVALHVFVTRRLEHVQELIGRFAAGGNVEEASSTVNDEIGEISARFQDMAHTVRREMTERELADERLRRANRSLRAISHCNQALVHATDEPSLLKQICRVIVEDGGYRLAWVAFARSTGIVAAAQWGADDGYIAASVRIWESLREQPGTVRDFLAHGHTRVTRDYRTDASAEEWRHEAVSRGILSSATFALREDGRTLGALMIYSDQAGAFDEQEMALLTEMAEDLAYGIQALRTRTRRMQAEEAMREANERYARQESALAVLTRLHVNGPEQFSSVLQLVTEVVANTLEVDRASVWRQQTGDRFVCEDLYQRPVDRHSPPVEITGDVVRDFVRMLTESDLIVSPDVSVDPRIGEVVRDYMKASNLKSFLSAPIRHGDLTGTLSCSTIGVERKWTPDEQTFIVAVANLLSSLFAQVERQRLEAQLRQATKLEGIGQLAGGVAHDFNNVLTVILGKAGQIIDDSRLPVDLRESTEDIVQSAERAANLTRQLLAFSRRQAMQVRDHDLNAVIRNVARLLDRILGEDLALELALADEPTFVRADAGMLDQVVVNLAVNARDAMRGGGRLTIRTSVRELNTQVTGAVARPAGPYACLQVIDTGTGIAKEHLAHIFEPFFTTKDVGKGTGLGLATTYGIVQQHNGWIEVDSEVGVGTTFSIYLPSFTRPDEQPDVPPPVPEVRNVIVPRAAAFDRELILVVEDEEDVRSLIVDALIGFGYRVLEATSGPEALDEWARHGASIDLLITDMVMPGGMNGLDLVSRVKEDRPGLRVIYISGYLADVSRDELAQSESASYLAKPFTLPTLARMVRETLDAVPQNNP